MAVIPDPPTFDLRYVAFMDLLGFSEMVRAAEVNGSIRRTLMNIAYTLKNQPIEGSPEADLRFNQFSDCIVISAARSTEGLREVILACQYLARRMLESDVLMRGGIVRGSLLHTEDAMYGLGLVEAVKLDTSGSPPRISLSKEVHQDQQLANKELNDWIVFDDYDLNPMIHILHGYAFPSNDFNRLITAGGNKEMAESIQRREQNTRDRVAATIERNAFNVHSPADVRAKWRWLRTYWNRTAAGGLFFPPIR